MRLSTTMFPLIITFFLSPLQAAEEPHLNLISGAKQIQLKSSELLASKEIETIQVEDDPTYGGKQTYSAVPMTQLLSKINVPADATLEIKALDGFTSVFTQDRLLHSASQAYLAVEPPQQKWKPLKDKGPSAGPFYLVWKNSGLSKISREEWPFQVASIEVKESLFSRFPAIHPDPKLASTSQVQRGFHIFVKNCFTCHTLNRQGSSLFGPDLNEPLSPVEYFKEDKIRLLIRNPQNLRHWPQSRMPAFSKEVLSDSEIDDILAYFKHMAKRRKTDSH